MDIMYLKYSKNEKKVIVKSGDIILKNSNVIDFNEIKNKKQTNSLNDNSMNNNLFSAISNVNKLLFSLSQKSNKLNSSYSDKVIKLASLPQAKNNSLHSKEKRNTLNENTTNSEITQFFFDAVHKNHLLYHQYK